MKTLKITFIIIIVSVIFALLPGIIPNRKKLQDHRIKHDLARPKMTAIESAIEEYCRHTGQNPKTLDDLIVCPGGLENVWAGPYLKKKQILDTWNNPYIYEPNGTINPGSYDIISYSADGKPGGEGENEDVTRYTPIDGFAIDPDTGGMM